MPDSPSLLSLVAAALYGLVAAACVFAALEARRTRQQSWHAAIWLAAATLFALLIVSRVFSVEDFARLELREALRARGEFGERRDVQGWFIAVVLAGVAAAGLYALYTIRQRVRGRRNVAVAFCATCCGMMLAIMAMRLISLHAMDSLLYGPLKLNWIGDLGASFGVMGAAIYYVLLLRGRIGARPR